MSGPPTPEDLKNGTRLKIKSEETPWTTLELSDGSTMKIRINVNHVVRLDGKHNSIGDPIYVLNAGNQIRMENIPQELIKVPTQEELKKSRINIA